LFFFSCAPEILLRRLGQPAALLCPPSGLRLHLPNGLRGLGIGVAIVRGNGVEPLGGLLPAGERAPPFQRGGDQIVMHARVLLLRVSIPRWRTLARYGVVPSQDDTDAESDASSTLPRSRGSCPYTAGPRRSPHPPWCGLGTGARPTPTRRRRCRGPTHSSASRSPSPVPQIPLRRRWASLALCPSHRPLYRSASPVRHGSAPARGSGACPHGITRPSSP